MHLALAAKPFRVIHDAHVFFAVVTGAQVLHTLLYLAHTRRTKAVTAAGVFHGDAVIECDMQNDLAIGGFHFGYLAVLLDKGDCGHNGRITGIGDRSNGTDERTGYRMKEREYRAVDGMAIQVQDLR